MLRRIDPNRLSRERVRLAHPLDAPKAVKVQTFQGQQAGVLHGWATPDGGTGPRRALVIVTDEYATGMFEERLCWLPEGNIVVDDQVDRPE